MSKADFSEINTKIRAKFDFSNDHFVVCNQNCENSTIGLIDLYSGVKNYLRIRQSRYKAFDSGVNDFSHKRLTIHRIRMLE